ncbi:SCO family protein [Halobacillus salinarum]|uniref:SCO family protein n=1 Tax=Halobacillus salinarum TaxID=2932257 RepID=A0ABY4EGP7_9BACI|nr:SCO family protein [Halobacillus salinarum]UOQ43227.1 SCO family protein [Halobacillus salinarum]
MRMTKFLLILLSFSIVTACGSPIEENMSRKVGDFSATTQNGESIHLPEDLHGNYWIIDFFFTSCKTVCPPMTGNLSRLQSRLEKENLDTKIISISVDPSHDQPKVLKKFSEQYQADYSRWSFLTGYSFEDVKELSIKSFQSPVSNIENSDQVAHGTRFFLVTPEGKVIKRYKGTKAEEIDQIIEDLKKLKQS